MLWRGLGSLGGQGVAMVEDRPGQAWAAQLAAKSRPLVEDSASQLKVSPSFLAASPGRRNSAVAGPDFS